MYGLDTVKTIFLEITNRCQASCPMCARNYHGYVDNPNVIPTDWTTEDFKKILTPEVLHSLDMLSFIGNYGDCIVNSDLLDMIKYVTNTNPNIRVMIHTNGSARSTSWWTELATSLPKSHDVVFGIDGLEDTHHYYRIGTKYETILRNAKAFIDAGGEATWDMIRFKHNEHQVDDCRQIAKDTGFKNFTVKDSGRFKSTSHKVLSKDREVIYYIEPPTTTKSKIQTETAIEFYRNTKLKINCESIKYNQLYIDHNGHVYPCCFVASVPYMYNEPGDLIHNATNETKVQHTNLISRFGGYAKINAKLLSISDIISSEYWRQTWEKTWAENSMFICSKVCGQVESLVTKSMEQFVSIENLKGTE